MHDSRVPEFFEVFGDASAGLKLDVLGYLFADPFLSAEAAGARPIPRDLFLQVLPRRAALFADAGLGPAALAALSWDRLDDHYLLARTEWSCPSLTGGAPKRLSSSFLLHDDGDRLQIVLYLNHEGL